MLKLRVSKLYREDTISSYNYIKQKLKSPMAAKNLKKEINEKLFEIKKNPTHRPLANDLYLANLGYRIKKVKNYMIFYIIDDDDKHIKIVRFLYCKRNWMIILKETNLEEIFDES